MLDELLRTAKAQGLISAEVDGPSTLRNMFAHDNDAVLNPAMFLAPFELVIFHDTRAVCVAGFTDSAAAVIRCLHDSSTNYAGN